MKLNFMVHFIYNIIENVKYKLLKLNNTNLLKLHL